ncbi:MAG: hypothetical protein AVDCRST_MAG28-2869 [uncultured Rubrobacteraceae bacterium]|uniref:Uncharacterized protein n=1 Tax=uncultured Rubrobacteraceae bacterium TaxID=349277 RepID=A0A6J4QY47_9ACTN|nr:MAG: hypothetical protein AVDCRST_MAG28-2869 [uncultured Rubrobacteraceae bacterium]
MFCTLATITRSNLGSWRGSADGEIGQREGLEGEGHESLLQRTGRVAS